ncbi:magnesium and cobalt transport protein CorA [Streptomyces sp. XM4193]|uniref:magnesium and cobalt transport protein CorA n=1 Tax=Streptomyces sp. XM4193 TaxID=2929782 RepID=UPI001FFAA807|nr:magnesium and cobalt transport protein CorA [Streptomyces sp. XM4193]MCK1796053.1 magnesium and cobalt transport protein CorA [Streptomyces sp. XM4193]
MSMIRELRSVVRPSLRRERRTPHERPLGSTVALPSAVVDCAVYREGRRVAECLRPEEALRQVRRGTGEFVWIGLHEPTEAEFAGIAAEFGLHPLAVEDAVQAHQRPKLERYDDSVFTVFKTVHYVNRALTAGAVEQERAAAQVVETGEVACFTGLDYIITVRHGVQGSLRALRHRLEQDSERLAAGPSAVLHAIADQVVDGYLAVAAAVQEDIDEVEIDVFSQSGAAGRRGGDAGRIYQLKREVLEFKRAVSPLLRPMRQLSERPMTMIEPDIQKYFRDVADHLARVNEQVLSFDDLLNSILQANLAQATVAQNEDMRKITAWAAIFAVPTMIAGVYGMNFEVMPETEWTYGYPMVMAFICAACFAIHRGFRRNGWL